MDGATTTLFLAEISDKMPPPIVLIWISVIFWVSMFGCMAAFIFALPKVWPALVFPICLIVSALYWHVMTSDLDDHGSIINELGENYITIVYTAGLTPLALTLIAIVIWKFQSARSSRI
ncbi:MAG: hypothetical protein HUU29_09510 [Planctomycetaceae bacterium]|nr:hypothetical protein [Planctomycetaceae bacterium]